MGHRPRQRWSWHRVPRQWRRERSRTLCFHSAKTPRRRRHRRKQRRAFAYLYREISTRNKWRCEFPNPSWIARATLSDSERLMPKENHHPSPKSRHPSPNAGAFLVGVRTSHRTRRKKSPIYPDARLACLKRIAWARTEPSCAWNLPTCQCTKENVTLASAKAKDVKCSPTAIATKANGTTASQTVRVACRTKMVDISRGYSTLVRRTVQGRFRARMANFSLASLSTANSSAATNNVE
mmetsp:Transcript_8466/g.31480  ORF Transcript_8466/g.31480 Transcript_8466/m.31480 type:complete len:238 (+) Transcript_8466:1542-2255(+)